MAVLGHDGTGPDWPASVDSVFTFENSPLAGPDSKTRLDAEFANSVLLTLLRFEETFGAQVQGAFASLAARLTAIEQRLDALETPPP